MLLFLKQSTFVENLQAAVAKQPKRNSFLLKHLKGILSQLIHSLYKTEKLKTAALNRTESEKVVGKQEDKYISVQFDEQKRLAYVIIKEIKMIKTLQLL